jgi:hypothetical protein
MMRDAPAVNGSSAMGGPAGSGLSHRFSRAWGTRRGRRGIIFLAALLLAIAVIGLGVSMVTSLSGESQSYRDGFSVGGSAYGAYSSESPRQACKTMELGGLRSGEDSTQWIKGCIAAFDAAASDN